MRLAEALADQTSRRAILVTQWFPPEPSAQPLRLARAIRENGFLTEVMTGIPNYPTGEVLPGYRALELRSEEIEGLTVHRSPLVPSHDSRAVMRMINYLSWAISATVTGLRHLRRADVALVYSSPATAALPALVAQRFFGTPYVLLIQDIWPDSVFSSGFLNGRTARPLHRIVNMFVNSAYRRAAHVAVISPGMIELLRSRGVPQDKMSLLYNAFEESGVDAPEPVDRRRWGLDARAFVVAYAGNHGAAQDLETVIKGVSDLPADSPIHLVMIGDGVEKERLKKLADTIAAGRVHFEDPVPRSQLVHFMAASDAQLVSLADRPLFSVTMPSKVQSALAAGQPVFAVAKGDVRDVVLASGAGVVAEAGSPTAVTKALLELSSTSLNQRREMAERARSYYETHMSADAARARLGEILSASCRGRQRDSRQRRAGSERGR